MRHKEKERKKAEIEKERERKKKRQRQREKDRDKELDTCKAWVAQLVHNVFIKDKPLVLKFSCNFLLICSVPIC
jgi:hypothetical protein